MTAHTFSLLFVIALLASLATRIWLSLRQRQHVLQHRGAVPAAFADRIELPAHQKAADYTLAKQRLLLVDLVVGTLWVLALTLGGALEWMSQWAAGWATPPGIAHGLLLFGVLSVAGFCIDLPISLYRTFVLEERFGFNRMTWRVLLADTLKGALLAILIGAPLLAVVLWLMGEAGAGWWVWAWLFFLAVQVAGMIIYPLYIAPLFNKFTPLDDAALVERIQALLTRCGFRSRGVFVMDGSRRSAHGNAYFVGIGAGKRIVFFDTLLKSLDGDEIEAVLAHELGHFHHRHLWQRMGVSAITSLALLAGLGYLLQQPWFFTGLGVQTATPAAALILFSAVLPLLLFPLTPLGSLWSRRHEFEADAYAARNAQASKLISALVKLYEENASTLTPDPLHSLFYDSHPPAALRIPRLQSA